MRASKIKDGKTYLGIELGSTRIKACLIDDTHMPIAVGDYAWNNRLEGGYWTYDLEDIHVGLKACFASLRKNVLNEYGIPLTKVAAMGISGMMHGYLVFDKEDRLLAPFRTWRNTTTEQAAEELTKLFGFHIPQRWSIAHLYQAILNGEEHVGQISHMATLSGYVHYLLTGRWETGACDGSGMFPLTDGNFDESMLEKFEALIEDRNYPWRIRKILPKVRLCGATGAYLTEEGAKFLDETGTLEAGIPVCPPEGDAGTGMVATNSVKPKTGNVSAGTSVFSMLVLEKNLQGMYEEIDVAATPEAHPVAMVHSNNGCSELDVWVEMFGDFAKRIGADIDKSLLYKTLYENALNGDEDCGQVIAYNYLASEHVTGVKSGKPLYFREPQGKLTLANFFRAQLHAAVAILKIGMELLVQKESISAENFNAHGGLFKVKGVAQQILANALNTPVTVSEIAGEGGAWGMALLANYMMNKGQQTLGDWLETEVFATVARETILPVETAVQSFETYLARYKAGLCVYDQE